jgi:glyoxylase-like metal-dependent hydrolase (beta-lactamase superfamily II)
MYDDVSEAGEAAMINTRKIGDAVITRVQEFSGPTHPPEFLFPAVGRATRHAVLEANRNWLAPQHYVPQMDRLIVTIQFWLVQAGGNTILVDTGVGNRKRRPVERMNMLNTLAMEWLEAAGAKPEQVTHVVHTHLHVDHVGWNTVERDGRWVPNFPNARYLIPRAEFDYWKAEHDRGDTEVQGGAFADSVLPIVEAGLAEFFEPDRELAGCLLPEPVYGHAPGMVTLRLRSGGEEGLFTADTMHSPIQVVRPDWNDRYVLWADQALAARAATLQRAAERNALIMPFHFGAPYCGYVRRQKDGPQDGYTFEPAAWP